MRRKKKRADFVKLLESQLEALRARRFDELDVETLVDELEGVVGRYRSEVGHRAKRLMPILLRSYDVYGDWNDLRFEWDMLRFALADSPSLVKTARAEIREVYEIARLRADLHGEPGWPKRCPWASLKDLLAAVKARDAEYVALERAGNADFAEGRVPRKPT